MDNNKKEIADKLFLAITQLKKVKFQPRGIDGLTHSEVVLLFCIKKSLEVNEEGVKVSQLSKILKVASPTVTQQINSMEKSGFVKRTMDLTDRRVVRVNLTEKGEVTIKKANKGFWKFIEGLVDYLGNEKSEEFAELLSDLAKYMKKIKNEED
ncbi:MULTISPECIES: MarR family winged helix-turn-helix transcriptional regulator [Clostridium]|uniref:MarR family winged helix-turn-helix transcriptional regulator n=1 Tax=Clostridium TaxID=1485 RepID=UPI00082644EA|nr:MULTISPECIES: MarR family transcriptional regulator [Clostridium]PJI08727.1 MarR family transcriptional regulator [Clostridium sp. CT7]